jgi:hypothetical protein
LHDKLAGDLYLVPAYVEDAHMLCYVTADDPSIKLFIKQQKHERTK